MLKEDYRDFHTRQREIREDLDCYLNVSEVKKILNCSYREMFKLFRAGELPVSKLIGEPIARHEITEETTGLRVLPSDLQEYIDRRKA